MMWARSRENDQRLPSRIGLMEELTAIGFITSVRGWDEICGDKRTPWLRQARLVDWDGQGYFKAGPVN